MSLLCLLSHDVILNLYAPPTYGAKTRSSISSYWRNVAVKVQYTVSLVFSIFDDVILNSAIKKTHAGLKINSFMVFIINYDLERCGRKLPGYYWEMKAVDTCMYYRGRIYRDLELLTYMCSCGD